MPKIQLILLFTCSALYVIEQAMTVGADGLRCDSCGNECSSVCGSRAFRSCCYNYIKKRSDPQLTPQLQPHPFHTSNEGGKAMHRSADWTEYESLPLEPLPLVLQNLNSKWYGGGPGGGEDLKDRERVRRAANYRG